MTSRRQDQKRRQLVQQQAGQIAQLQKDLIAAEQRLRTVLDDKINEADRHTRELTAAYDHTTVLQSDRDRLTVALEVCARRLASPAADRDVRRGGWRAANQARLHDLAPIETALVNSVTPKSRQ